MPYFESYAEVEVDVDEFIDACSDSEIEDLLKRLERKGYINPQSQVIEGNMLDQEWSEVIAKISGNGRLRLSNEEEDVIRKIANRL